MLRQNRSLPSPFDLPVELQRYRSRFPKEEAVANLFLDFVSSTPDHFRREHLAGHMTGSAFVTDESNRETLLVHHRKLRLWVQPGGHADGNEDLRAVARQELEEETGVVNHRLCDPAIFDIDRHLIPARQDAPEHYHYDIRFLFAAPRSEDLVVSHESIDVRWFSLLHIASGEIAGRGIRIDESVRRMADKALERNHPS